jgi:hypothetical protein
MSRISVILFLVLWEFEAGKVGECGEGEESGMTNYKPCF